MSREVRKVPADWQHPKDGRYSDGSTRYIGLLEGFSEAVADWERDAAAWARGEYPTYASPESIAAGFEEWSGPRPDPADYMPEWPEDQRTHFMMYETCTEGSPISPAFATAEELARWLADNDASAFGSQTATYEQWLATINGEMMVVRDPRMPNVLFL